MLFHLSIKIMAECTLLPLNLNHGRMHHTTAHTTSQQNAQHPPLNLLNGRKCSAPPLSVDHGRIHHTTSQSRQLQNAQHFSVNHGRLHCATSQSELYGRMNSAHPSIYLISVHTLLPLNQYNNRKHCATAQSKTW